MDLVDAIAAGYARHLADRADALEAASRQASDWEQFRSLEGAAGFLRELVEDLTSDYGA